MVSRPGGMNAFRWLVGAATLCVVGCYSTGDGPDPPASALYFPVGLAVSPGGNVLYVANSDFDLQFNSGTVEAYDLLHLRTYLSRLLAPTTDNPCAEVGLGGNAAPILYPG